jgi:hypothetical protein
MAYKGKKKSPFVAPPVKKTSKTQFDRRTVIAEKMLKIAGYPDLFDTLSKNQKKCLLCSHIDVPEIRSEKANTVPRHYVNNVHDELFDIMRANCVGDHSIGLSYMEFFSYGVGFMEVFKFTLTTTLYTDKQKEIISRGDDLESYKLLLNNSWSEIAAALSYEIRHYSQIQFRTYGHTMNWSIKHTTSLISYRLAIRLTSCESEHIYFFHKNLKRLAYRIWKGDFIEHNNQPVTIPVRKLFPYSNSDKSLDLFIQAHAIHRYKERFEIFDPTDRNYLLISSLFLDQEVKMGLDGPMIACTVKDTTFGYFPFTIQGDKLIVLTFLPLINDMTCEGKKFMDKFNLKKEDLLYLGMNKLGFFGDIDFDQIPVLKKALIDLELWGVKDFLDDWADSEKYEQVYDPTRTSFVKNFFEKQNLPIDNTHILEEIAAKQEAE